MSEHTIQMIEDEKLDEKREEFFKLYKDTFGADPKQNDSEDSTLPDKIKVSINIFGIKADV